MEHATSVAWVRQAGRSLSTLWACLPSPGGGSIYKGEAPWLPTVLSYHCVQCCTSEDRPLLLVNFLILQ